MERQGHYPSAKLQSSRHSFRRNLISWRDRRVQTFLLPRLLQPSRLSPSPPLSLRNSSSSSTDDDEVEDERQTESRSRIQHCSFFLIPSISALLLRQSVVTGQNMKPVSPGACPPIPSQKRFFHHPRPRPTVGAVPLAGAVVETRVEVFHFSLSR